MSGLVQNAALACVEEGGVDDREGGWFEGIVCTRIMDGCRWVVQRCGLWHGKLSQQGSEGKMAVGVWDNYVVNGIVRTSTLGSLAEYEGADERRCCQARFLPSAARLQVVKSDNWTAC